jgi:hypothetical protein
MGLRVIVWGLAGLDVDVEGHCQLIAGKGQADVPQLHVL